MIFTKNQSHSFYALKILEQLSTSMPLSGLFLFNFFFSIVYKQNLFKIKPFIETQQLCPRTVQVNDFFSLVSRVV